MEPCPFCSRLHDAFIKTRHAVALLDKYPVARGHSLVVPRRHVASVFDLPAEELASLWQLVAAVRERLLAELAPDGLNVGLNDGPAAGQTVEHAHIHIIPRHNGEVLDPRGGIRWVLPQKAKYWE